MKVLHVLSAMDGGGVESSIMTLYRAMDRNRIHFDFAVFSKQTGMLENEARAMGSEIYHLVPKRSGIVKYAASLRDLFRNHRYDIIHCHQAEKGVLVYYLAKKYSQTPCIMHAHCCWDDLPLIEEIRKRITLRISSHYVDGVCACSKAAAESTYASVPALVRKSHILYNTFDIERFLYSAEARKMIREKYRIKESEILLGMVGRLSPEKNNILTFRCCEELMAHDSRIKLMFVGAGVLEEKLRNMQRESSFGDRFIFCGNQVDVEKYYSAMDGFLMLSEHEGFGMALVEAQINGLPCVASSVIPDEAVIIKENVARADIRHAEDIKEKILGLRDSEKTRQVDISRFDSFRPENMVDCLQKLYQQITE